MKQFRIYVDTSVVGGCFDAPFADASRKLFEKADKGEIELVVSAQLFIELAGAPQAVRDYAAANFARIEPVLITQEAQDLRNAYLLHGVVGRSSASDALHVALATIAGADVIASWNFKHLVHLDKFAVSMPSIC